MASDRATWVRTDLDVLTTAGGRPQTYRRPGWQAATGLFACRIGRAAVNRSPVAVADAERLLQTSQSVLVLPTLLGGLPPRRAECPSAPSGAISGSERRPGLCGVCPSRCGLRAIDQARGHCQAGALAKSFGATDSTRSELGSVAPKVFDTRLTVVAGLVALRSGHTERDRHHAPAKIRASAARDTRSRTRRTPARRVAARARAPRTHRHTRATPPRPTTAAALDRSHAHLTPPPSPLPKAPRTQLSEVLPTQPMSFSFLFSTTHHPTLSDFFFRFLIDPPTPLPHLMPRSAYEMWKWGGGIERKSVRERAGQRGWGGGWWAPKGSQWL